MGGSGHAGGISLSGSGKDMRDINEFIVGQRYTNDEVRLALRVENLGGIRPSLDEQGNIRHLAIMTAAEGYRKVSRENPYYDRIEDDILLYTAQGRQGDQLLAGRNKRLIEQYDIPIPFFCFVNHGNQVYEFLGLLELVRHYQEMQVDNRHSPRKVWVFELKIHRQPEIVPIDQAWTISAALLGDRNRPAAIADERELAELPSSSVLQDNPEQLYDLEAIRSQMLDVHPYVFEKLVAAILKCSGFASVNVTRRSGDGGIDLSATVPDTDDFFAGTFVQFQAKRWRHAVGSVEIKGFRGAIDTTAKGVFVTTSHYTRAGTIEAVHPGKPCITLIDGIRLSSLVLKHDISVQTFL